MLATSFLTQNDCTNEKLVQTRFWGYTESWASQSIKLAKKGLTNLNCNLKFWDSISRKKNNLKFIGYFLTVMIGGAS